MSPEPDAGGFYGKGILSGPVGLDSNARRPVHPKVEAVPGLDVEQRGSGVHGVVISVAKGILTLRVAGGRDGQVKLLDGGFNVGGQQVTLVPPTAADTRA